MSERNKWSWIPWPAGELSLTEAARRVGEAFGGHWSAYHVGDVRGVPEAVLVVRYSKNDTGRWIVSGVMLLGDAITAEQLRRVPISALENSTNLSVGHSFDEMRAELDELRPLARTDDMSPEEFSELVAAHFAIWARYVPHPAAAMAAEWKVKAPTVHTWIREARLRGVLPPARRGKAG